jgi:hypothetical protein
MSYQPPSATSLNAAEDLRLEAVTVSVGFDDLLDETLTENHAHFDTMIVVSDHSDLKTKAVAQKHGAMHVPTDLFQKNGRTFNKGAAINAGFGRFQYHGWRMHLDSDIILPDNFRRVLFNHTSLDRQAIYGADRVNLIGRAELQSLRAGKTLQYSNHMFVTSPVDRSAGHRFVHSLHGYLPIGYFQLWHCSCQKDYPYSLGNAAHDDMLFSMMWPEAKRFVLPSAIVYHLCERVPVVMENWEGDRHMPRLGDGKKG